ncbi:hypothetical protein ACSBR1_037727 [Camellia fascicularis]
MKHLYKLTPFLSRQTIGSVPSRHFHTGDAIDVGRTIFYFRLLHSRKTSKSEDTQKEKEKKKKKNSVLDQGFYIESEEKVEYNEFNKGQDDGND